MIKATRVIHIHDSHKYFLKVNLMRSSAGSLALITRVHQGVTQYLLQYNPAWQAYNLIGGHREPLETFTVCMERELIEELQLYPGHDFSMQYAPVAQLKYRAFSESARQETWYHLWLFEVALQEQALAKVSADPDNCWVTLDDIQEGQTPDGKVISSTVSLLFRKTGRLPVPVDPSIFTIGVTGHREWSAPEISLVCQKIGHHLDHAETLAQGKPITILSPLAMGADQLVAEIGLMRGYRLIAPLPFPRDIYKLDFGKKQGRLRTYLDQAAEWFSLPTSPHYTREELLENQAVRDQCYKSAGEYVVDRSNYLLALWDGNHTPNSVGTSATVHYALKKERDDFIRIGVVNVER